MTQRQTIPTPSGAPRPIPTPDGIVGLKGLRAILGNSLNALAALQVFHAELGDVFRANLPNFRPVIVAGPEACRWVLTDARADLRWRIEPQPITDLLHHGLLVTDGPLHDDMRVELGDHGAALHLQQIGGYADAFDWGAQQVLAGWRSGETVDLLVEVRKMALLGLMQALFDVDFRPHLARLWRPVLILMGYISPGLWLVWPGAPSPGVAAARQAMDAYWYRIIAERRALLAAEPARPRHDMLSMLIRAGHDDSMIRDQLMTMLTAGHDTTTAALAWVFTLLAQHPDVQQRLCAEIDAQAPDAASVGGPALPCLDAVYQETLRLYPPAHMGGRVAARDLEYDGYLIPEGTRVFYSIFLTQRDPHVWGNDAGVFRPERVQEQPKLYRPYTFLPFGGGKRNCIGKPFADLMSRVILIQVLREFNFTPVGAPPHMHMGATIEPRPGVRVKLRRR